jgi:hypothetical protein
MRNQTAFSWIPWSLALASWIFLIAYMFGPPNGAYWHFLFGKYKAAEHIGLASFWSATVGALIGILGNLFIRRGDRVLLYGTYACVAALLLNIFGPW